MRSLALLLLLAACPRGKQTIEPVQKRDATSRLLLDDDGGAPIALPLAPAVPAIPMGLPQIALPDTVTPDAVALGELLFHDPRLAASGNVACASCHDPALGYAAGAVDEAKLQRPDPRPTLMLVNLAWQTRFGWEGRSTSLDDQLQAHVDRELGQPIDRAVRAISDLPLYRAHLARLGGPPQAAALHALEAFVLTRFEGDSPWDCLERDDPAGKRTDELARDERAGYRLFMGKARCAVCHPPPLYTDLGYHRMPQQAPGSSGFDGRDQGTAGSAAEGRRGSIDWTHIGADKTATLRGMRAWTQLDARIRWYSRPDKGPKGDHEPVLDAIHLSDAEQRQLESFVRALTAEHPPAQKPVLP